VWTQWRNRKRLVLRQLLRAPDLLLSQGVTQMFSKRHVFVVLNMKTRAAFTKGRPKIGRSNIWPLRHSVHTGRPQIRSLRRAIIWLLRKATLGNVARYRLNIWPLIYAAAPM